MVIRCIGLVSAYDDIWQAVWLYVSPPHAAWITLADRDRDHEDLADNEAEGMQPFTNYNVFISATGCNVATDALMFNQKKKKGRA